MKRFTLFFLLLLFLTAGCAPAEITPTATAVIEETPEPTQTFTATVEPTSTPTATASPLPTVTYTPQPTATSTPEVISAETARGLAFTGRLGGGAMVGIALAPDALNVVVLTTLMLKMYAVESGDLLWEKPSERVFADIAFSDDGSQVIARTRGGTVQRWDAASGEKLGEPLPIVPNTRDIALSGDGAVLVALDNFDETVLWDTTTGDLLQTNNGLAYPFGAMQVAASSDAQTFLNSGIDSKVNYQIRLWDVRRGRFLTGLRGLVGEVYDLQFSPDGQFVTALDTRVSGGLHGMQYLYLWRVSDGMLLDTVDLSLDVSCHTFLGDGATVLAGTADGKVLFANFRFGERYTYGYIRDTVYAHESAVVDLSSNADGTLYASAAADGSVKVWNVASGEEVFSILVEGLSLTTIEEEWTYEQLSVFARYHYPGMDISPADGLIARTGADLRSIDLIDPNSSEVIRTLKIEIPGYFSSPVFSPNGKTLAAAFDNNRIIFWDVESGNDILRLTTQHIYPISKLQFSPDGTQIASLGNGELFVWNLETISQEHALTAFRTFTYSSDGKLILTDAQEEGVFLIDAGNGKRLGSMATDRVNDLAFSPDNLQIAVAGYRSQVRYEQENLVYFLDVVQQKRIRTIELTGYPAEVMKVAYSPDGSLIISIDRYGSIYIWNAATGTLLQRFEEQAAMPADIRFTPDGRTLMIAGSDNTIQSFEIQP
jgi:WD40 repeat protein